MHRSVARLPRVYHRHTASADRRHDADQPHDATGHSYVDARLRFELRLLYRGRSKTVCLVRLGSNPSLSLAYDVTLPPTKVHNWRHLTQRAVE